MAKARAHGLEAGASRLLGLLLSRCWQQLLLLRGNSAEEAGQTACPSPALLALLEASDLEAGAACDGDGLAEHVPTDGFGDSVRAGVQYLESTEGRSLPGRTGDGDIRWDAAHAVVRAAALEAGALTVLGPPLPWQNTVQGSALASGGATGG
jgi:hypothetical protein